MLIHTEHLCIRKFVPGDADDLAEILTDPEVTYFEPYATFTEEACVQEAVNFSESDEFYAVVLGGKVIGKIYFSPREYGTYEIGYTFNRCFQGQGYACESVGAMIHHAFSVLGVRRIVAEINTRNAKSIRLAERLAMRREAEHRQIYPSKHQADAYEDFYIYALLKCEHERNTP